MEFAGCLKGGNISISQWIGTNYISVMASQRDILSFKTIDVLVPDSDGRK